MKKLFMKVVTGLLALGCLFAIAGCSSLKLDIDKAEDVLREKNYEVQIKRDSDFEGVEVILERSLSADKDDEWIDIYEFENNKTAKMFYQMKKGGLDASIQATKSNIEVYEYILEEYSDKLLSDEIDEFEDALKVCKKELVEYEELLACIGISGKYVWHASHKDVIKDLQ